jgi:DNA polymerase elongation subunit (family B)
MSYVDAIYDKDSDRILIAERIDGKRIIKEELPEHVFYYSHPQGRELSIFGDPVRKYQTHDKRKFRHELERKKEDGCKIFESDIDPVFRYLANHYRTVESPALNVCFFDIEVDFDPERGYAPTDDTYSPITAISLYNNWEKTLYALVLCPPTLSMQDGQAIIATLPTASEDGKTTFVIELFEHEKDLLNVFIALIADADCLSGWNSEGFDVPYVVNRMKMVLGEHAVKQLSLWDREPKSREYQKFQKSFKTYELVGRVHLDYLLLYQKHNPQQQQSYRLDYIGEIEVGDHKVAYDGTLDDLYKKDFKKFVEYSIQDVMLMVKIDAKRKFIDLANQVAHDNCILLKTTMGTVSFVEQAIINEMHEMGFIVPDRKEREGQSSGETVVEDDDDHTPVVGAYVAKPKVGVHSHIGAVDINSLYPSTIRALNMSPETIFGQVRPDETMALVAKRIEEGTPRAEAWEGIFALLEVDHMHTKDDAVMTVDFEDGRVITMTGVQLYDYVFNPANHICITANGTLFRTDKDGMIPKLLGMWYADRKRLQKLAKKAKEDAAIAETPEEKAEHLRMHAFYDQRQYAGKIRLNALYGALLQKHCRFYDDRIGQSTTLTGRSIDKHMAAQINEIVTGKYDYRGDAVYYCDTDSCYFSAYEVLKNDPNYADFDWSRENVIELYDAIAESTNATFADFMMRSFNTSAERGAYIAAGRELIASKTLFIKKKKYACLIYDLEGMRLDKDKNGNPLPGKLKAMGLDLKRSDTPKFMQDFLQQLLMDVLQGADQDRMYEDIKSFREAFAARPGWEKGSPKKVSNMTKFSNKVNAKVTIYDKGNHKVNMPGHVRASINWNNLCEAHNDKYSQRITDGTRIIVCKLKPNPMRLDSVAYPVDEPHIPKWFKDLPFDSEGMEEVIVDNKVENLVGVLHWDLSKTKTLPGDEFFSFNEAPVAPIVPNDEEEEEDDDDE